MTRVPSDTDVGLRLDAGDLTLANAVERLQALVDYARSKGAPEDAGIEIAARFRTGIGHVSDVVEVRPQPMPHEVRIWWPEPACVPPPADVPDPGAVIREGGWALPRDPGPESSHPSA